MGFERAALLWLLPLCVLPVWAAWAGRRARVGFPDVDRLARDAAGGRTLRVRLVSWLSVIEAAAVACLILAAAGPYGASRPLTDERAARDIVIAVDVSESMCGLDFPEGARTLVGEFLRARRGDRVGLVAFGGSAVTQCPLTFDRGVAEWLLGELRPEMLGRRTALGDGIALGVARLGARGGALVVLSDGENTAGMVAPMDAARAARERGVRIYAIGIGSGGRVPVPVRLPSGRTELREKDYPLDEAALRAVAESTGGTYSRASDAGALAGVLAEIGRLEARPTAATRRVPMGRSGAWLALAAAATLCALTVGSAAFLRTAPRLR